MTYPELVKKLTEQIKSQLVGYSKLASGTNFDSIINTALTKGYVAINPQVGGKKLGEGMGKQLVGYFNAALKAMDAGIPTIGLGKANAPKNARDISQTLRQQIAVQDANDVAAAKRLTDAQAVKDVAAARKLASQKAAIVPKTPAVLTQVQQDEKVILDAQRELKAQQRLEKAKADLAKANAATVRPLAKRASQIAQLFDPETKDINLIAGEINSASSDRTSGKVNTIKSISDEIRKKKGLGVQAQSTRDLYTPIVAEAFKVKPGDVTEAQRELYSSLYEYGHAVDTNKMSSMERLKSLADEATFRSSGTATQAQHMARPRELAANEMAKQMLQNAANQGFDLGVPSGLTPHVPPTPAFGVTQNAVTRLPSTASIQAKVQAATQVLAQQAALQAVQQATTQVNQVVQKTQQTPNATIPAWMQSKVSPWQQTVNAGYGGLAGASGTPVPSAAGKPSPAAQKLIDDLLAQQVKAIDQNRIYGSVQQKYPQVWSNLQRQDLLNGTKFANPANISSYTGESNRGIASLSTKYTDEKTGMQMSNKTYFNPQTGQILTDFSNRFSSLTQRIARNTKEFIGWTAAVTLVYMPLQKMGQLLQATIDQEARLADVSIVMQLSQQGVNKVFFDAADIARKTGQSLTGVIEGYAMAAQATAGYADEAQRLVVTNKLLYDSIILAKLSGMSQAESTDTLVAALTQMGLKMDQGQILLDKWQATARAANVPMATLASTFAIVGQAAQDAGLNMEQLNAITAVVAAAQITSAKETGNAMRGIIAGYTTQGSQDVLRQFGISVKDTEGNMRGLLDVYSQVAAMIQSGAINESQKNRIAMAMTGGNRGMSRVTSLLLGTGDVNSIVAAQANPEGQAQRAVTYELQTTQTAITNLGTSFSELARTMGTEGGLLPTFKFLTSALTWLVDGFTKITSVMGASSLTAIALALAYKGLFTTIGMGSAVVTTANLAGRLAGFFAGNGPSAKGSGTWTSEGFSTNNKQNVSNNVTNSLLGNTGKVGMGIGLAVAAAGAGIPALMNLAGGNQEAAIADIGGGIAGGILGAIIGTGNPALIAIGATVGASAGEAFLSAWNDRFGGKGGVDVYKFIPGGVSPEADQAKATAEKEAAYAAEKEKDKLTKGEILQKGIQGLFDKTSITQRLGREFDPSINKLPYEEQVGAVVAKAFPKEMKALLDAYNTPAIDPSLAGNRTPVNSPFVKLGGDIATALSKDIKQANTDAKTKLQIDYYSPTKNISRAEYQRQTALLTSGGDSNVSSTLAGLYKGKGGYDKLSSYNWPDSTKATTWADALKYITETIMGLSADQLGELQSMTAEMTDLEAKLAAARIRGSNAKIKIGEEDFTIPEVAKKLQGLKDAFGPELRVRAQQMLLANAKPPSVSGLEFRSKNELDLALSNADKYQKALLAGMKDTNDQQAQQLSWDTEKVLVKLGDAWVEVSGKTSDALSKGLEDAQKAGNYNPNLDIQTFNATPEQYAQAEQQYNKLMPELLKKFGPYGFKENNVGAIVKLDTEGKPMTFKYDSKTWSVMQDLLQKIVNNTKDVQGIYNLPEGSQFWVPYQAAEMSWNSSTGGAGGTGTDPGWSMLDSSIQPMTGALTDNSGAARDNSTAIRENTQAVMMQAYGLPKVPEAGKGSAWGGAVDTMLSHVPSSVRDRLTGGGGAGGGGDGGLGYTALSITIPSIKTQIDLTSNTDVTLTIDGNMLAKILSTKLGQILAQSAGTFGQTLNQLVGP